MEFNGSNTIKVYDDGKEMISPTEIVPNIVVQRWMNHQRRLNCEVLCDKVKGRESNTWLNVRKLSICIRKHPCPITDLIISIYCYHLLKILHITA
jgi:hypothetical protein